uniref:Enoyl-CoA hydratase n=1 Tax=Arcella intermedia TaxID=1963864 RepID=A0A6B2LDA4_9EUKA
MNAINIQLQADLFAAADAFDKDKDISAIVITGAGKAFAAGADIKMMAPLTFIDVYKNDYFSAFEKLKGIRKPVIAAVNGFALGGGCELAMSCDIILASESAKFGQPEITLGTIPGIGGTQRLTKAIGKSKAMEWVLSGGIYDAFYAERAGLVSRVIPDDQLIGETEKLAQKIASMSQPIAMLAKQCINASYETTLDQGLQFEKKSFQSTFATKDQKEGMDAFISKRPPVWKDE